MGKKTDSTYEELAEALKKNLDEDRRRLSDYLTRLILSIEDGDQVIIAADAVAKISDALTKQTHLSIDVMKIVAKARTGAEDGSSALEDEIGRPFDDTSQRKGPN